MYFLENFIKMTIFYYGLWDVTKMYFGQKGKIHIFMLFEPSLRLKRLKTILCY